MKLRELRVRNFVSIVDATIDFDLRGTHYVFGLNGVGKSSIREAITFALTGRGRVTTNAGAGAAGLIRDDADKAVLQLSISNAAGETMTIARQITGDGVKLRVQGFDGSVTDGDPAKAAIARYLGSPELLVALTDASHVLGMSTREQGELLAGVIDCAVTAGELFLLLVQELGVAAEDAHEIIDAVRETANPERITPADLARTYKGTDNSAYERRTAVNRKVKELAAQVALIPDAMPIPTEEQIAAARAAVTAAEDAERAANRLDAQIREQAKGLQQTREAIARLERSLAEIPAPTAPVQTALVTGPALSELEAAVTAAERVENEQKAALDLAVSATAASDRVAEVRRAAVRAIEEGRAVCDGACSSDGSECPTLVSRLEADRARLPELRSQLTDAEAEAARFKKAEATARATWNAACARTGEARAELSTVRLAQAKTTGANEARRREIESSIAEFRSKLVELPPAPDVAGATAATKAARATLQRLEEVGALAAKKTEHTEAVEDARFLDVACNALKPDAAPGYVIARKIGPFVDAVNAALAGVADFTISVATAGGLSLQIQTASSQKPRPSQALSVSEQYRVGACLSVALAKVSGLNFAVLDGIDVLLPDLQASLDESVARAELDSVVLLSTIEEPRFATDDEVAVWWVEDGSVRLVEAEVAVEA